MEYETTGGHERPEMGGSEMPRPLARMMEVGPSSPEAREMFLSLAPGEVREIAAYLGRGESLVFMPDGTRRAAIIWFDLDPSEENFHERYASFEHRMFLDNMRVLFEHGANTVFSPILNHENLERGDDFIEGALKTGFKALLRGGDWLDFYRRWGIRVRCYGDRDYMR
ncbi:MAG: hypothetical protein J7L61_02460, partial [Thermoplasmata archaeon]|nr:hypothetical protein [Thermoplasmata archaeon]